MGNALVVRNSLLPKSQTGSRAAQYVRMSTDLSAVLHREPSRS